MHTDDATLIAACLRHDRVAQECFYQKYFDDAYRTCNRYLRQHDDVMSVVNTGFLKVFQHLDRFRFGQGTPGAWIHRIMVRTAIDHLRREQRDQLHAPLAPEGVALPSGEEDALSRMRADEILRLVKRLPPVMRAVFNFAVVEGYAHKDIARELQISESTSRWHLAEAKKRLQVWLQGKETIWNAYEAKSYT